MAVAYIALFLQSGQLFSDLLLGFFKKPIRWNSETAKTAVCELLGCGAEPREENFGILALFKTSLVGFGNLSAAFSTLSLGPKSEELTD